MPSYFHFFPICQCQHVETPVLFYTDNQSPYLFVWLLLAKYFGSLKSKGKIIAYAFWDKRKRKARYGVFESQAVSSNCKSVEHDVHLKWIGDAI